MSTTRPRSRSAGIVAALACLGVLVSGCSLLGGGAGPEAVVADPAPLEAAAEAEPVEVIGAAGADRVRVGQPESPRDPGGGLYYVSELYPLSGTALTQPVLVRMALTSAVPDGTPLTVSMTPAGAGDPTFLPGRLDAEGRHVEFVASELGTVGVLALDVTTLRSRWGVALDAAVQRNAVRPGAAGRSGCVRAEDDYRARSWKRDTLAWCLDRSQGAPVLKVTNLRGVPVRVTAPGAVDSRVTGEAARPAVAWEEWTGLLAGRTAPAASAGATAVVLEPARTLSLPAQIDPGTSMVLVAEEDERDRRVQLLHAMARASTDLVEGFGLLSREAVPDAEQVFARWAFQPSCRGAVDRSTAAMARGCLHDRALTRAFGSASLLLGPAMSGSPVAEVLGVREEAVELAAARVEQRIEVRRERPDFGSLVGSFRSESGRLEVSEDGTAVEEVLSGGQVVATLRYRLTDPASEGARTRATATLQQLAVSRPALLEGRRPMVGDVGTLAVLEGRATSAFLDGSYCTAAAASSCAPPRAPAAPTDQADRADRPDRADRADRADRTPRG